MDSSNAKGSKSHVLNMRTNDNVLAATVVRHYGHVVSRTSPFINRSKPECQQPWTALSALPARYCQHGTDNKHALFSQKNLNPFYKPKWPIGAERESFSTH